MIDEDFEEIMKEQNQYIEELEERLKAATDDAKEAEAYAGELEAVLESIKAKLAKALDFIQDLTGCEWPYDEDAKRILAELTGGKDE